MNVSFGNDVIFVYTRDPFGPIRTQQRLGEAREGERSCLVQFLQQATVLATMAEPGKKRRISHANSNPTSSNSVANIPTGHQPDRTGEEGRMEGSILRLTMKNFL